MFVIDHARRLIQILPSALPRHVAQIGVFQIKRREQFVEAAELQKFSAGRKRRSRRRRRRRDTVPGYRARCDGGRAGRPAATRIPSARFLRGFCSGSEKKIWQETEKTFSSVKPSSSGCRKSGFDAHVAIEQHDDIVARRSESRVRAAAETQDCVSSAITRTLGNRSRMNAALPSVEPLSTTITSLPEHGPPPQRPMADTFRADPVHSSWE